LIEYLLKDPAVAAIASVSLVMIIFRPLAGIITLRSIIYSVQRPEEESTGEDARAIYVLKI
jgi:hypothetical protein